MLFLKSTSINEIFNKKNRLNSSLQPFKALSERRRGRDKEELSQNRNSVREKEKNYKAIYSTDNAAKGKRIRWGFLLGSRDAHSKNRGVSFRHGEGRISGVYRAENGGRRERHNGRGPLPFPVPLRAQKKPRSISASGLHLKRRLPTLPLVRSTIGVAKLNFSVRNGKRWNLRAIVTLISFQLIMKNE